jgi:hypothetical protein
MLSSYMALAHSLLICSGQDQSAESCIGNSLSSKRGDENGNLPELEPRDMEKLQLLSSAVKVLKVLLLRILSR